MVVYSFIATWDYAPVSIVFTAAISTLIGLWKCYEDKLDWDRYDVGLIEGQVVLHRRQSYDADAELTLRSGGFRRSDPL